MENNELKEIKKELQHIKDELEFLKNEMKSEIKTKEDVINTMTEYLKESAKKIGFKVN